MVLLGLAVLAVPFLSILGFVISYRTRVRLDELADTVAVLEKRIIGLSAAAPRHEAAPAVAQPKPSPAPAPVAASPAVVNPIAVKPAVAAPPVIEPAVRSTVATPAFNWEQLLGIRGAAWVGGIALVIAALFFARWTIDRGFFTPIIRVGCLLLGGIGALGWAERRRREGFHATAGPVSSAGIVMLYVAFFAGHTRYDLFGIVPAFIGMSVVTAAAAALSMRYAAMFNAVLGIAGGLATPVLLSSGSSRPEGLFLYLILLNAGYLLVSKRQHWQGLVPLLVAGTTGIQMAWFTGTAAPATLAPTLVLFAILAGVYSLHALGVDATEQPRSLAAAEIGSVIPLVYGVAALDFAGQWPTAFVYLAVLAGLLICAAARLERRWPIGVVAMAIATAFLFQASSSPSSVDLGLALAMIAFASAFSVVGPIARSLRSTWLAAQHGLVAAAVLVVTAGMFAAALVTVVRTDAQVALAPGLLFAWLAVDITLVLLVAGRRGWPLLVPLAAAGGVLFCASWQILRFESSAAMAPAIAYLGTYVFFLCLPFVAQRGAAAFRDHHAPWLTSALIGPAFFLIVRDASLQLWGDAWIGGVPLLMAGMSALALKGIDRRFPSSEDGAGPRLGYLALFATIALGFVAVAIALQVGRQWITIGWAIEAAAVCWLFGRLPHPALKVFASILFALVGVRLLANPVVLQYEPRGWPIVNWLLYTYAVPVGCCFAGAHFLRREEPKKLAAGIALLGLVLIFWLVNLEIADFYSVGRYIVLDFTRNFERDLVRSLAWGAYALTLMGVGIWRLNRHLRIVSLGFLLLTIGKVFLYDLSLLGGFYRVLSFLALGIALIMVSMLYQRYVPRADEGTTTV